MAKRPVFIPNDNAPHYSEVETEFRYYSGFADNQAKKSIRSLHDAYLERFPEGHILEISSKSENPLGERLSAFHLRLNVDGEWYPVENVFQSGKVFEGGGPFADLLNQTPAGAKKDPRLRESGSLTGFCWRGEKFPLIPRTFFYDWIYIHALRDNPETADALLGYDAFTDIAFNPQKSINCQARTAAIYVALRRTGELEAALRSSDRFLEVVYGMKSETAQNEEKFEQESLFN